MRANRMIHARLRNSPFATDVLNIFFLEHLKTSFVRQTKEVFYNNIRFVIIYSAELLSFVFFVPLISFLKIIQKIKAKKQKAVTIIESVDR